MLSTCNYFLNLKVIYISLYKENCNYGALLDWLLLPDEDIVAGKDQTFRYLRASIKDKKGTAQQELNRGMLILTNKRLLFISCNLSQGTLSLSPIILMFSFNCAINWQRLGARWSFANSIVNCFLNSRVGSDTCFSSQ